MPREGIFLRFPSNPSRKPIREDGHRTIQFITRSQTRKSIHCSSHGLLYTLRHYSTNLDENGRYYRIAVIWLIQTSGSSLSPKEGSLGASNSMLLPMRTWATWRDDFGSASRMEVGCLLCTLNHQFYRLVVSIRLAKAWLTPLEHRFHPQNGNIVYRFS